MSPLTLTLTLTITLTLALTLTPSRSASQTGKVGKILGRVDQQVERERSALSYEASELLF